tara:strand:- start:2060 stop:2287 length:228 start_codon:yes stop_codon:yes gene_type:complete
MGKTQGNNVTIYDIEVPERDEMKFLVLFPNGERMWYARALVRDGEISFHVDKGRKTITITRSRLPDVVLEECGGD